jgi:hypothetical protein
MVPSGLDVQISVRSTGRAGPLRQHVQTVQLHYNGYRYSGMGINQPECETSFPEERRNDTLKQVTAVS